MTNLKEYLLDNTEATKRIVQELNSWNNCMEHLDVRENNDEEFFNIFFAHKPMEAVRAAVYGDYNYTDGYVRFNGYGNLESLTEWQLENEIKESIEEIITNLIENQSHIWLDEEVEELIEKWDSTRQ